MTRTVSTDRPANVVAGLPVIEIATASAETTPALIKIAHRGELRCRDGRVFNLVPEAIVARFKADATDVAIDIGHATARDNGAPACGWLKELQAKPDGLYGRPEWLPEGAAILKARTHRYVSPAFMHDDKGQATWLHSVGLVAAPALSRMPALAAAGHPSRTELSPMTISTLATALGVPDNATEAACLSALHAGFVPKAVHQEILAQLSAAGQALATIREERQAERVDALLEGALRDVKITPAERAHYAALCATPAGFDSITTLFASMPVRRALPGGSSHFDRSPPGGDRSRDPVQLAADAQKIADARGLSLADAMVVLLDRRS